MKPECWRAAGEHTEIDGHRIFYRAQGAGPTLLCVHGFPTCSWDWHRVWPGLTERFRLIAPDLLGYGFSAKPRKDAYSTAGQADRIEALLVRLGIDRCRVLAHDYGDTVVQEMMARAREGVLGIRLQSVCFLNGGLFPEAIRMRPIQHLLLSPLGWLVERLVTRGTFGRSMRAIFGPGTQPTEADLDALWHLIEHGGGRRIVRRLIRYQHERRRHRDRWVRALTEAGTPTRLVVGAADPVSGDHMARRYRELVPKPDVVVLEAIGHFPQLEDPGAVERSLLEQAAR